VLDIFSFFRRRAKPRKRKPSGSWRVELEKIGGLVKKAPQGGAVSGTPGKMPGLQPQLPAEALHVEPLRDEYLLGDTGRLQQTFQHPLHPDTFAQESYRPEPPRQQMNRHAPPPPPPPGYAPQAPYDPSQRPPAEPRFVAPRPRRAEPAPQPAVQGYLAAHSLEKSFGARKVVRGASLFVRRGEAVGLLGPNGAGKTTIFYMITGLIKAERGKIELDGNDVTSLPMYQRARLGIGYLPQEASIFRGLNVEDNIRSVLEVIEPDPKQREHDLENLLDEFNIARLRKSPSIALSGGERRRVEIARALATRPSYMLLDEPFAGIDPIAVGDIQVLVKHLTRRGIGVLITDHNVRETLGLTDRGYIIYSGEVLMEGRAEDIVNNPDVRRLYLGEEFRL
jgi:lipopolysaccharide export system ATP-binding protein